MGAVEAGRRTILIAEDSEDDAEFLRLAVCRKGMEALCRFVCDGEEAIAYMRGDPPFSDRVVNPFPTVLILDLDMPKLDGFGVMEWMAKTPGCESVKVVVWTGWSHGEVERRARKAGAGWFVNKVMGGADLAELVALMSDDSAPLGGPEPLAS